MNHQFIRGQKLFLSRSDFVLGMLFLMIVVIVLKSRARHCRCSFISRLRKNHNSNHPSKSTPSFDLDYWLKQVELREAKEAERLREVASPHLELPKEEPRDTQQATASWIVDAWQHWYLVHHEPRHSIHPTNNSTALTCPSRRRPYLFFHRLFRRLFTSSKHRSPLILTDIYANVLDQDSIRASTMYDLQPRRVASWPCMQATSHSVHGTISALRIKQARQDLLQRTSKSTHHI